MYLKPDDEMAHQFFSSMHLPYQRKPEDECVRWLIFKQVNYLKTTTYSTGDIFTLQVLGSLTLVGNLGCNAEVAPMVSWEFQQ